MNKRIKGTVHVEEIGRNTYEITATYTYNAVYIGVVRGREKRQIKAEAVAATRKRIPSVAWGTVRM